MVLVGIGTDVLDTVGWEMLLMEVVISVRVVRDY